MRAHIRTFGCRANQYDSEMVRAMIVADGGECVDDATEADVIVLNSCAVTADAEADLRQTARRIARESTGARGAPTPTIVMGCASARDDGRLAALPGVTHVIAGAEPAMLASALGLAPASAASRTTMQTGSRALLRIQDGCDEHCTFCATTLARGASRSRSADDLVREAARLAEQHPEIVITGVHIGSFGADADGSLGALVERLVAEVPAVRFRLTSVEATEVDARLAALLRDAAGRVAPHLHAPLQSGSDRVLKRMGRHWYTAASYADAVLALTDGHDRFALSGDVITGFPGESDDDHARTRAVVEALPFTDLHVFPYSPRPGTTALRLGDSVEGGVARERAAELRALAAEKAAHHRSRREGGSADVVVIGDGARRHGLTEDYLSVALDDPSRARRSRFGARLIARDGALCAVAS